MIGAQGGEDNMGSGQEQGLTLNWNSTKGSSSWIGPQIGPQAQVAKAKKAVKFAIICVRATNHSGAQKSAVSIAL